MKTKTIKVDTLARVEGEGALYVKINGDEVMDVKLKILSRRASLRRCCAVVCMKKLPTLLRASVAFVQ